MYKQRAHLTGMPQSPGKHNLLLEADNVQEATRLYPRLMPPQTAMRDCLTLISSPLNYKSSMSCATHAYTLSPRQSHIFRAILASKYLTTWPFPSGFQGSTQVYPLGLFMMTPDWPVILTRAWLLGITWQWNSPALLVDSSKHLP